MDQTLILTGDMNFKEVTDPAPVFAQVAEITHSADMLFGNLECCFWEEPGQDPAERGPGNGVVSNRVQRCDKRPGESEDGVLDLDHFQDRRGLLQRAHRGHLSRGCPDCPD